MAYHSAYRGIATGANGEFDHFVRQLDPSHLEGGYWRFQSIDDDRRAMARGFTTPEDVLQAADSSEDRFDEIIIRWVRGANDASFKMAMSGTAHQHLQTIYELRSMLRLPMSSRGQVPLYTISTNPRLRQYWEAKYRAQRPTPIDPAIQLPERPMSSSVTPGPVNLTPSQAQQAEPSKSKSPVGRVTRARSAKLSQAARPKPAAKTTSAKQKPSTSTAPTGQSSSTSPSSEKIKAQLRPEKATNQHQIPFQSLATQPLAPAQPGPSISANVPTIPRAALEWGLQPSPKQATSNPSDGVSQYNWVHSSARLSAVRYSPYVAHPQQQAQCESAAYPLLNTTASTSGTSNTSNIPIRSPTSGRQDKPSDNTHTRHQAYAPLAKQQPSIKDLRSLSISDSRPLVLKATTVPEKPLKTIPEPWGSYMRGLEQLPCADCGEDDGHLLDCNLGNIAPMQNLTVLDYRTLTDAVERFDPSPWTTHFVPPEPEPEDAATQMRGMATVIRNEDSYKQDPELHGLPDDLMMMLWAFKTSENIQVINEDGWDAGIGDFEMW
ncbi:hypothetical protein BKA58DRAFT_348979 [Alternaria rosae]|uniref:uncharacterized protein n=1 Tax=Alternaria rosae TaxID=1187941 RepID=UPI001E8D2232|nr:uncharacterized protein BKA58DRAFT_348979 [Alternaria rosae]KAH6848455.1 hypothetical protein BKA58DRAFT_348979 [Alternaria rosae]